jgi:site-specific DNA-methyltransferase (adenine-specific)
MDYMRDLPDKAFDLAIVDPPYGINIANQNMGIGSGARCSKKNNRLWTKKDWDLHKPDDRYFFELTRISCRQIIWGGNYFDLPPSQYFAVWDKGAGMRGRSFAEGEFAWVSSGGTRIFYVSPVDKSRIHPTQKPVKLYELLLNSYAKLGDRILDTHLGSGSSAIAAHYGGFEFVGCELDADYFEAAKARFERETAQLALI